MELEIISLSSPFGPYWTRRSTRYPEVEQSSDFSADTIETVGLILALLVNTSTTFSFPLMVYITLVLASCIWFAAEMSELLQTTSKRK